MKTNIVDLPVELLDAIVEELAYPDALALKLTCRGFHGSIHLSVRHRVSWLLGRTKLGLSIPNAQMCNLSTDAAFCSSPEVRRILFNRRKHYERHFHGGVRGLINGYRYCSQGCLFGHRKNAQRSAKMIWLGSFSAYLQLFVQGNVTVLLGLFLSILTQTP